MDRNTKQYFTLPTEVIRSKKEYVSTFLLLNFLFLLFGCRSYYEVNSTYDAYQVEEMHRMNDYIVLHHAGKAWHFTDIVLDKDKQEVRGRLGPISEEHRYYLSTTKEKANRYIPHEGDPTYEGHIYASEYIEQADSTIHIPLSAIERIDIYDKDVGATTTSAVLGVTASIVGSIGLLVLIVALTKSSCPFVYVNDGVSYRFVGEMYGGAIYASLQRDDYMPIPEFVPVDGNYELKIANKLQERQYTDLAELICIEHPIGSELIIDKYGGSHTIIEPIPPISALNSDGMDITELLLSKDSISYYFDDAAEEARALSGTSLTFEKPQDAEKGKLFLNAKNSFWLDHLFGQFTQKFGTSMDDFIVKQRDASPDKYEQWKLDQGIPLSLSVKIADSWESVDYFYVVGPLASRDLVMEIDLSRIEGDRVELKLECGFMFWELDYAAMDFSAAIETDMDRIAAHYAVDETGADVLDQIHEIDGEYLYQPEVGNVALIKYKAPDLDAEKSQTVFLHSHGYYEYIRNYQNKPDYRSLKAFKKEGALIEFSKDHYKDFMDKLLTSKEADMQ